MKKVLFFVCLALGAMTSCYRIDRVVEYELGFSSGYEPVTDSTYRSWIISNGEEFSTFVDYVALRDTNCVIVKKTRQDDDIKFQKRKVDVYLKDDLIIEAFEHYVILRKDGLEICCVFESFEPHCYAGTFPVMSSRFDVVNFEMKELPDETIGEEQYYCKEVLLVLEWDQGEKKWTIDRSMKVMEKKQEIMFIPTIGDWNDENVFVDI